MNIEIISYDVYRDTPYDQPFLVESFKTLEEAVNFCETHNRDRIRHSILLDYEVIK